MGVSARWAAGIACVEIRHDRADSKRAYLRLSLDEAKKLRADLETVIAEREEDPPEPLNCESPHYYRDEAPA